MKRYAQQPRYNYTIIWNFLCDDLKKLQQFKTLISFKYVVSKVIHGELIHRYIIYDIYTYIFNENLPKISGMLNPFCTRVRLGYVTDSSQTLQWLVYVWHHPFFCTSVRHHFVCFYSWHLQNCFDDCDGSSQNRYLSCLFERFFQKGKIKKRDSETFTIMQETKHWKNQHLSLCHKVRKWNPAWFTFALNSDFLP